MKLTTTQLLLVIAILVLAMLACLPLTLIGLESIPSSNPAATQMAATVQAMLTQNAVTPTQVPPTQVPPTQVPPTQVPPTQVPPTQIPPATPISYCNWLKFVDDVTVPDGSNFSAGETFTKIWRLKNTGTCAWTTDTKLVFVSGSQMSGPTVAALPGYVAPGQMVDVSVTLTAPSRPGSYTGYWMLRSSDGTVFGTGVRADTAFYVDIDVDDEPIQGTVTGLVCYPSEFNPRMTLYFENVRTGEVFQFAQPQARNEYKVVLPNGRYYAYAWAPDFQLEGAYVNPDRTLKSFPVRGGQTTTDINLCDWDFSHPGRGE
jgi:hypothetical protein